MLTFNLRTIFAARGIDKPYSYLVKNGITPHSATRILNNNTSVVRLDHIEALCEMLCCEPNDLLVWKPSEGQVVAPNHPLNKLRNTSEGQPSLHETLSGMPYQLLKELSGKLTKDPADND